MGSKKLIYFKDCCVCFHKHFFRNSTHHFRRSHMAQLWAQTAACYFKLDQVNTFSGGTEEEIFAYDSRCREIAREMFYLMSQVSRRIS